MATTYVDFNGIDKRFVHKRDGKDGKPFWSVGIFVPNEISRDGIVNVTTNKEPQETKNDPSKVNVGWPEDWNFKTRVCTFHDREDSSKNRYADKEFTAKELKGWNIQELKARKDRREAAGQEAPAEEAEGPELG